MKSARIGQTRIRFRANISALGRSIGMGQARINWQWNGLTNGVQCRGCFAARALPRALSMRKCPFRTTFAKSTVAQLSSVTAVWDLASALDKCFAYLPTLFRTQIGKLFADKIGIQNENCVKMTTFGITTHSRRNQAFGKNKICMGGKRVQFRAMFTHYVSMKYKK